MFFVFNNKALHLYKRHCENW